MRKAKDNIYRQAREELKLSREAACYQLGGITPAQLEKIETGYTAIQPQDVVQMARAYKNPFLCNHYCANDCAIGIAKGINIVEEKELGQIAIETFNTLRHLEADKSRLLEIAEDGIIDDDQYDDFRVIMNNLDRIALLVESMRLWLQKKADDNLIDLGRLKKT